MSRRLLKAAEAIREVVSLAILTEIRDPRVKNVTVTQVEVAPDMRSAKVYVSIMGEAKEEQLALNGLQHSAGFLQHKIADRIDTRYTPRLQFVLDKGVKNALAIAHILKQVLPPAAPAPANLAATEVTVTDPVADSAGDDSAGDDSAGDDSAGDDSAGDDSAGDDSAGDDSAAAANLPAAAGEATVASVPRPLP